MPAAGPDKQLCGAQRLGEDKGVLCKQRAGWGTDHPGTGYCKRHGGNTATHRASAQTELVKQAAVRYGLAVDIDPAVAMMQLVAKSYGSVLYLEARVAELDEPFLGDRPHVAWQMLQVERKHHAEVCRDAVRAGVERRAIELAEGTARQVVQVMAAFAARLGFDPADPRVREAGREALQLVEGGGG